MIDFHTHAFPDKIVQRAMENLAHAGGGLSPVCDGSPEGLCALMDDGGVSLSVLLHIATNPRQMTAVNDFALACDGGRFVSFGSVHPRAENAVEELHRLRRAGIKGIKLHPEYQDFYVDDDTLAPLYEALHDLGFITVFHAGLDIGFPPPAKASPVRLAAMLPAFGDAPVVLAHMGGYAQWEDVLAHLAGKPVYFDTSFCYSRIPLPLCAQLVAAHGAARILFGSDAPWASPAQERRLIDALGLTDGDRDAILFGNARALLRN
ncbi:MAG: amidohydrolase family protein [Oscillospiraceae bacterium]|jgi:predicted TIM-barrel fold metal-dependent hydrolase|nr:amidohydrolase family protein [Oscillospiraceae bacterium]